MHRPQRSAPIETATIVCRVIPCQSTGITGGGHSQGGERGRKLSRQSNPKTNGAVSVRHYYASTYYLHVLKLIGSGCAAFDSDGTTFTREAYLPQSGVQFLVGSRERASCCFSKRQLYFPSYGRAVVAGVAPSSPRYVPQLLSRRRLGIPAASRFASTYATLGVDLEPFISRGDKLPLIGQITI